MVDETRHIPGRCRHLSAVVIVFFVAALRAGVVSAGQGEASIYGLVTDESGAVLPGVTVTVSSPALQVRTVASVTAADGEYRVTPLPIGVYQVEFTLQGFQTVRHEEVRLTVGFAAKVDVKMHVGNLEETVTVTGAAPIVDVTQTSHSTTLTREVLELTPTGRAGVTTLLAQVPGTRSLLDIGGSSFNTDVSVSSFGQPGEPQSALEGVITRFAAYWNYMTVDEVQATTVGSGAEVETRGVQINAITKSGSNQFHGEFGFSAGGGVMQSDNVTDELKHRDQLRRQSGQCRNDFRRLQRPLQAGQALVLPGGPANERSQRGVRRRPQARWLAAQSIRPLDTSPTRSPTRRAGRISDRATPGPTKAMSAA